MAVQLEYSASPGVAEVIADLRRTEDICFSPDNRRLLIAGFARHQLTVFDIDITPSAGGTRIALTGGVQLSSPALRLPHGVAFVGDDTVIVSNRFNDVSLFKLPPGASPVRSVELEPLARWPAGDLTLWNSPGSVAVARVEPDACEVLICNNESHTVTRNHLGWKDGSHVFGSEIVVHKYLRIPDGVALSADRRWMAVSNHSPHSVLLYEAPSAPGAEDEPYGVLRGAYYPHGLRFSADGRHLFVVDAGAPFLHVYVQGGDGWRGVRHPAATVRIMDATTFARGRHNPEEGGAKGIALDAGSHVLATTCESQPLAFWDLPSVLRHAAADGAAREQSVLDVRYELSLIQEGLRMASEATQADFMRSSLSWRLTAPLRRINRMIRRPPRS